jgi:hypothetical protein
MQRHYELARRQVVERLAEIEIALDAAERAMADYHPAEAVKHLGDAKAAIEGAMTTVQWATTLQEDG